MKTQKLLLMTVAGITLMSCKKEEEPVLTDEQTTEVVESTVSTNDAGVTTDYTEMAKVAVDDYNTYKYNCTYADDTTYTINQSTGIRTYNTTVNLAWTVDCNGGTVNAITFDYNRSGSYSGPKLTRSGSETGQLTFTNLESADSYVIANGSLTANGNLDFSVQGDEKTASTVMTISLSELQVDKTSYEILSGSGTLNVEATGEENSTTLTGSIIFVGGGQATVTVNGYSHTFDLYP